MVQLEMRNSSPSLPEELVESIIAMMPFPSIFKARTLSKAWHDRFSSVASLEDEGKKQIATRFQKLVSQRSGQWGIFCPISMGRKDSFGYESKSRRCRGLPSLFFLPDYFSSSSCLHVEGARLLLQSSREGELCVANILTRSWKVLPPLPNVARTIFRRGIIVSKGPQSQKYKVFVFVGKYHGEYFAQVYDSESDAWSTKKLMHSEVSTTLSQPVYLDGVLYIVADFNILLAFNAEEMTWEELHILDDLEFGEGDFDNIDVVVCNGSDLMIVRKDSKPRLTYQMFKVDLGLRRLVEVARGPPEDLGLSIYYGRLVSHGGYIFFGREDVGERVLAYNVNDDEWDCFEFPRIINHSIFFYDACSFQPGINPFVEV